MTAFIACLAAYQALAGTAANDRAIGWLTLASVAIAEVWP